MTLTRSALVDDLRRRLGEKAVVTDADVLDTRRHDAASFCDAGSALALVRPTSTEEVRQVVLVAREHRVPLVTQGERGRRLRAPLHGEAGPHPRDRRR